MKRLPFFSTVAFRVWLAIVLFALVISTGLAFLSLGLTRHFFFEELRGRVQDIAVLGARTIDSKALDTLESRIGGEMSVDQVSAVEGSADYRIVSDELNAIRDIQKDLILYVYTLVATPDQTKARFLVDADVLALESQKAADSEISHFNQLYDISAFPDMKPAFGGTATVENSFTYDATYKAYSFSGYVPLPANGGIAAILGIDVASKEVNAYVELYRNIVLVSILFIVVVTIIMALFIVRGLTRSLAVFFVLFGRAIEGDLTVRYPLRRGDAEIMRTAEGFNRFMQVLHGSIADVMTSSRALEDRSESITSTSHDLAASAVEQAASIASTRRVLEGFMQTSREIRVSVGEQTALLERTVATLERLATGVAQVISRAQNARTKVAENVSAAEGSREKIASAVAGITALSRGMEEVARQVSDAAEQSETIDRIVQVIGEISDRTGILAINAAIEAARLGAEGSGFKVVADEIKKIAEATTGYAHEIKTIIDSIKHSVLEAASTTRQGLEGFMRSRNLAEETGRDLDGIIADVRSIDGLVNEIHAAAKAQGADASEIGTQSESLKERFEKLAKGMSSQDQGTREILEAMGELAQVAQNNASVATQLSELATLLAERSNELKQVVAQFKLA